MKSSLIGLSYTEQFSISQHEVVLFSQLSGDTNPLHLDPEYGKKSFFKRNILPGFLSSLVISKILGTKFLTGGLIKEQTLNFKSPMYINTIYTITLKLTSIDKDQNIGTVEEFVVDTGTNKITIIGRTLLKHYSFFSEEL